MKGLRGQTDPHIGSLTGRKDRCFVLPVCHGRSGVLSLFVSPPARPTGAQVGLPDWVGDYIS
jgi:hypothetical protein